MGTIVTRWLITQGMDLYQQATEKLVSYHDRCPNFGGTVWRSSGTAAQFILSSTNAS